MNTAAEFRAYLARIEENKAKGGASLRSAHAMDRRVTAKLRAACEAAGITLPRWPTTEYMLDLLEAHEKETR